ncbi:MAG: CYTH domain-containing protein [Bacilli bacterium]|nr:CYTH domain-containing protein [Bacilli bacterium]
MHTEYEVRVLEIDPESVIKKLEEYHAKFCWDHVQRRYVYDFHPKQENKWIRLRTNGEKTTLTIKNLVTSQIDGTQELEIEVDNFERCHLLLKELGYEAKGYQENRRIQYELNGVEIDIDYWPKIPTYLEIEGASEDAVYHALEVLGFSREDCTTRDVEGIYLDYGYHLDEIYDLKLEEERK